MKVVYLSSISTKPQSRLYVAEEVELADSIPNCSKGRLVEEVEGGDS